MQRGGGNYCDDMLQEVVQCFSQRATKQQQIAVQIVGDNARYQLTGDCECRFG